MKEKSKYNSVILIVLVISIMINIVVLYIVKANQEETANDCNYEIIQWCELINDYTDLINNLIIDLQYYDSSYGQNGFLENIDCWG